MKKILIGIGQIVLTVALVSTAAYALYSDDVSVSGLTLSTGSADLQINGQQSISNALNVSNVFPGWTQGVAFELENESSGDISLDTAARLVSATGDWATLGPVVEVAVVEYDTAQHAADAVAANDPGLAGVVNSTGWLTLATWNGGTPTAFGTTIDTTTPHQYALWGRLPTSADNTTSGKSVTVNYVITGTQH